MSPSVSPIQIAMRAIDAPLQGAQRNGIRFLRRSFDLVGLASLRASCLARRSCFTAVSRR